jgi:hypothetical protein
MSTRIQINVCVRAKLGVYNKNKELNLKLVLSEITCDFYCQVLYKDNNCLFSSLSFVSKDLRYND